MPLFNQLINSSLKKKNLSSKFRSLKEQSSSFTEQALNFHLLGEEKQELCFKIVDIECREKVQINSLCYN